MALIETSHLQKIYVSDDVETPAIKDISLSIKKGEFVAIMGPSGSGKSTLLHLLGFLDSPSGGSYSFEGKEVSTYEEKDKAKIRNEKVGFIFQSFNLLSKSTVSQNVMLPLLYSSVPPQEWHEKVLKAIRSVGLEHRTNHEAAKLSGGEKQRVAIARALINDPQIIFADEPTGNLDSASGKTIMGILNHLNEKEGHTIILITHETYTARYAKRIIRIKDGKVESDIVVADRLSIRDDYVK